MSPTISGGLMRRTLSIEDFDFVGSADEPELLETSASPGPPPMHRSESLPCFQLEENGKEADKQGRKAVSEDELASLPVSVRRSGLWPTLASRSSLTMPVL